MSGTAVDAYIRVSRVGDRQGERFISPELQRESIRRVCEREGLRVVKWFEELDASGGDGSRPKWNEAIRRVEEGQTRGIVCWNISRFSRSTLDGLKAIERVEKAGGKVYSEEGNLGKLDRTIRLAFAEEERDRARAGFQNAAASAIARGIYIAAKVPFGYERDPESRRLLPDPDTAPIVVELFELRAKGRSWKQLSDWMEEAHGVYKPKNSIRDMIHNPAYLGHARQGKIVNERAHEAIVSRRLWDAAQRARGRRPVHTGRYQNLLLRGMLTCGNCGHTMLVGSTKGRVVERAEHWTQAKREKINTYCCRNQRCRSRAYARADELDAHVTGAILNFFSRSTVKNEARDPHEIVLAEKELQEADYALTQFKANKKAIIILGADAWNDLLEEYVVACNMARIQVETLRAETPEQFNLVPELWSQWTTESRREFLGKVVTECSITPARRQKLPVEKRLSLRITLGEGPVEVGVGAEPADEGTWSVGVAKAR
jgi:DNA invertase Pin-like site-specific DNA recombinase